MPGLQLRRRRVLTIMLPAVLLLACLAAFSAPAVALWPFPTKRFSKNALLSAGSLGVEGRVIAFGDFNGDQLCVA